MTSLSRNIIVNYLSQLYIILVGLAVVPLYLEYMGIEAYGVIGFFTMLQSWMTLLDFGLSQTLGREASKFKAGVRTIGRLKMFLRTLEILFAGIALIVVILSSVIGPWIASSWLHLQTLNTSDVAQCITIVGCILALRLISGVYRGGLFGIERQVLANTISVVSATLKFLAVLPILIWVSPSILVFFLFQLVAAIVEVLLMKWALKKVLPTSKAESFQWELLREPLQFGAGLAFLSWVWIIISQSDKLILSHLLSMQEYGGFILATTVALGAYALISPLQQAILPRLIVLFEQDQHKKFVLLYRQTTLLMAAILVGIVGVMTVFPAQVLFAWTGNIDVAKSVAEILRLYALSCGFMALAGMPYVLQHARGNLKLHVKGSLLTLSILVPSVILFTLKYGALGAAYALALTNLFLLLFWTPVVHKKFLPEIAWSWLTQDVSPALFIGAIALGIQYEISWQLTSRLGSAFFLLQVAVVTSSVVLLCREETRKMLSLFLKELVEHLCKKNA
jgi:O-antigen/teichoic acid export membrane protein